mgnify:CR=1 FL=1
MLPVSQWWFRENPRDWCLQNKEDTLAVNVSSGEHCASLYPLYYFGAAAEGRKYSCDFGQILEPNHSNFDKTGHFQVNFRGNGLLEQWRTSVTESRPIPLCRPWIQRVYFIETWCHEALWRSWEEIEKKFAAPEGLQSLTDSTTLWLPYPNSKGSRGGTISQNSWLAWSQILKW